MFTHCEHGHNVFPSLFDDLSNAKSRKFSTPLTKDLLDLRVLYIYDLSVTKLPNVNYTKKISEMCLFDLIETNLTNTKSTNQKLI